MIEHSQIDEMKLSSPQCQFQHVPLPWKLYTQLHPSENSSPLPS